MTFHSSTGTRLRISASRPTTYDNNASTGYPSLTFTGVGEVIEISPIGKTYSTKTRHPIGRDTPIKSKTTYDHDDVSIVCAIDGGDAGQAIIDAAVDSKNSYSIHILGSDDISRAFTGKILSAKEGPWVGEDVVIVTIAITVDAETGAKYTGGICQNYELGDFLGLNQTSRAWDGMTALGTDVYACVEGGDIYKQTNGIGDFVALGQTTREWSGMTAMGTDVYACVDGGDIYKQTGGTGDFIALGQVNRPWRRMTIRGADIYAASYIGDIYIQYAGAGNFLPLGQAFRLWFGMTTLGGDVYACTAVDGDIYKQTGGAGDFIALGQTPRNWHGMTTLDGDVYACALGGDIYKQTGGTGDFLPLGQTARNWNGMTTLGTDVYASVYNGDIYKSTGTCVD